MSATTRLVADVGGTNTRLALFDENNRELRATSSFNNQDFDSLESIIDTWRTQLAEPWPEAACIAAAAPPAGDRVRMINIGWSFSCKALAERYGFSHFRWLNDFQANAHALPHLVASDLHQVHAGAGAPAAGTPAAGTPGGKLATVGPGTGLGGATLQWVAGVPIASAAEPGHTGLSPGNDLELQLFRELLPQHGDIYAELLLSGQGLVRLYSTIAKLHGAAAEVLEPSAVTSRGQDGSDPHCTQALETFCALLGSACGDFVLANGAYGGLFIAGGIVPRMIEFLRRSEFLERLRHKGHMAEHLRGVPVHVITADNPGLIGAAHAPLQAG